MTLLVGAFVILAALVAGLAVGLRRGPVVGVALAVGVVAAGVLGYFGLLALVLPH